MHGTRWIDEYAWMRVAPDRLRPYLHAERAYYDRMVEHDANLRRSLFAEVERRLLPTDESVRWRRGDKFYYTRTVTGSDYEQFLSSRDIAEPGTVVLDGAEFADPGGYVAFGQRDVSPDGHLLAYSVDTTGDEVYSLRFRDLVTLRDRVTAAGSLEEIPRTYYGGAFSADSGHYFYVVHDEMYRPHQVWRHRIGSPIDLDELVMEEADERFDLTVSTTRDRRFVAIHAGSRITDEVSLIPADAPLTAPVSIAGRRDGVQYTVDRADGELYIVTNRDCVEFSLMVAPARPGDWSSWREYTPPRLGERLTAVHCLAEHLVLQVRREGFPLVRIIDRATGAGRDVHADIPAGTIDLPVDFEFQTARLPVRVQSIVEPSAYYDVDLATGARSLVKRQEVPTYDASAYVTQRILAMAADGVEVPIDIAYAADTALDGTAPCLIWAYGAYESCDDATFDPAVISLLDRGLVYALGHPRGGGENGRGWWIDGHLAAKRNTFTDHLACADRLATLVDGARIATRGLSAGGLLQTAAMHLRPDRFAAIVAEVPFVDVIGSMSDPTIPLTVTEWDEWGDPADPAVFAWMRAYSPYENLPASPRPPMLVTAALHDPRVLVHEPTKYVARLRASAAPVDGELLYRVELGAGAHTGPSGRYAHYRYEAEIYAFVLRHLGLNPELLAR